MADKYYRSNGKEYNPDYDYTFTDKDGNTFTANGRNGYVWQAITEGVPISVNEKGEWYIEPYLDVTPSSITAHIPSWFKDTDEYKEWKNNYSSYIQPGINADTFNKLNKILKSYGGQGVSRVALAKRAETYGITDVNLQKKYTQDYINLYNEGQGNGSANISLYGQEGQSAADIAREFKNLSKEDLSKTRDGIFKTIDAASKEGWGGSYEEQEAVLNALQINDILEQVDDNYKNYGDGKEFEGLLQASAWQKIYSGIEASNQQTTNSILAIPGKIVHGLLSLAFTPEHRFDADLSKYSDYTTDYSAGAWLEGRDDFIKIGSAIGTVENFVTTYAVSSMLGGAISGWATGLAGSSGAFFSSLGHFMKTPVGSMSTDFFLHDLPIDFLNFFTVAGNNNWDWGKAWNDPTQEQNLIAIPFIGELGPKVDAGLLNDIQGDLLVDMSLPLLGALNKSFNAQIDSVTNGAATRFKEYVAVKNLQLQEKLTKTPVIGKGWQKMINRFMGAEDAAFIRDARKASIAEGNMDYYKVAQNVLTLKNHGGAEEVANLYKALLKKNGTLETIRQFQKDARNYGGIGKTKVEWSETKGGELKNFSKTVADTLPKEVKEGLLAIDRLSELRGEIKNEGGIISNPARDKEITELEQKVESLPQEIKDFANKFSEANKGLEQIAVRLGIKNEDWYKAMELDPRFEQYMTRQSLVPGEGRLGSNSEPAQLFKGRKGYYAENYLDPVIALNMKAAALGRAYAYNLQAKTLVAMQNAQGKIIAGKGGAEAAAKLKDVKDQIANISEMRKQIDYDGTIKNISTTADTVTKAVNNINDLLNAPEKISLESIYQSATSPAISEFVSQFETGKIKFGEGVRESANLTESDASYMIRNTYSLTTTKTDGGKSVAINQADNTPAKEVTGAMYNAGVAPDGTAYRYTIKDGEITNIKEITDAPAMAQTIERLGGVHHIDPSTVEKMGVQNTRALNRTVLFYRDNMPNLRDGSTFKCEYGGRDTLGWVPGFGSSQYKYTVNENGRIEIGENPVFLSSAFYRKGKEEVLNDSMITDEKTGWSPKNAVDPAQTPIHEMGHSTMGKLAVYRLNDKIEAGTVKLPEKIDFGPGNENLTQASYEASIGLLVKREAIALHEDLAKNALRECGYEFTDQNFKKVWAQAAHDNISRYAGSGKTFIWETFSEAMVDVWANGDNASKFSLAIVEGMRREGQRYAMAASPKKAMQNNGLKIDGLFKGEQYNFPASAKTNKQKANWLKKKRAENPYIKGDGMLTTEQYKLANKWDTFFKKEIESYDPNTKTSAPDLLIKKNGEFLEDLSNNAAKKLVAEVKAASVEGFDEDLAMIALGRSQTDIADAVDNFIINHINENARRMAERMEGGATEENLNRARITLWQDERVKSDMGRMLNSLAPDLASGDVMSKIDTMFKEQAEGLAAYEALPVDYKRLNSEATRLRNELEKSNNYARKVGSEIDKKLAKEGIRGDATQTIHFREGGEDVYVVVRDPVTASILKRPDDFKNTGTTANAFLYAANSMARMYRLGTTGINPIAIVRNVLRDPLQATLTAGFNPLTMSLDPTYYYKSWRKYGLDDATIRQVEEKIRTWASTGTMTAEIRGFGGELPGTVGYRNKSEQFQKWFNKRIDNSKIINILESPLEMWESTFRSQVGYQSFSKAMQRTGGDIDKSLASAMFDASNATTNFSHSIYFMRRFSSSVPYLASAINGTASFWRLFNIDPIGMTGRITAGILVPVAAITAWNLGDEERRKAYMNLPEWYRDGHFVMVAPDGNIFSLPIPDEIGNYFGTMRRLVEYTNEANQYSIPSIIAQGLFGFAPVEVDGFFNEDGSFNIQRGVGQMLSGLMPQTATVLYELAFNEKLYTGQDISDYSTFNKILNAFGNTFGSFAVNIINDLGFLAGSQEKMIVGKTTAETLARDLFGMGFDNAKQQFMNLVGSPEHLAEDGKTVVKATGLFKEAEGIQRKMADIDKKIAMTNDEQEKENLQKERQQLIDDFGKRVAALTNNYMSLFSTTGGLELWQRKKLIQLLALGDAISSAPEGSYQAAEANQADLNEYGLGRQRYVELGLPSGPTVESLGKNENGNLENSLDLQAAIDSFYGAPKQATQDYKNAIEESGIKDIRNEFYAAIQKVYDIADEQGIDPDYDLIERIQARYLQSVDSVLVPLINQYGLSILNNNDFIDQVRRQVNGMIPSDDWRQSRRNAKKFLSTKDFPTATVDVKKWLKERYTSNMKDRGLDSDPEVTNKLNYIKGQIDNGNKGTARAAIEDLNRGINKSNYYISSKDYETLVKYYNMVK